MTSAELFEKCCAIIPGGVNSPVRAFRNVGMRPFFTSSADGSRLRTADGLELIDYVCSWGPALFGHNHPVIREAIGRALGRGTSFGTASEPEYEMAQLICSMIPCAEMVRMTNSGTEATMSCIRLARGYTGRDRIVKFAGCYHGHSDSLLVKAGSGALTFGNPDSAGVPEALARLTSVLEFNNFDALEDFFSKFGRETACVIVEPYPANTGLIPPEKGFLKRLRELCTSCGTLLIFDEVITGFRAASGGAQAREGVLPDLCALGKIIGGGLPVGAFCGRRDIMEYLAPVGPVYQAGTLSGNPLAMAAGIAALTLIKQNPPYEALEKKSRAVVEAARAAAKQKGIPLQTPMVSSLFSFFFNANPVRNLNDALASDKHMYAKFFKGCLERGVYFAPSPFEICFMSSAHSPADIERTCEVVTDSILGA